MKNLRTQTVFSYCRLSNTNGIAVLRFDDRGVAQSTGDHSTATSEDFGKDGT